MREIKYRKQTSCVHRTVRRESWVVILLIAPGERILRHNRGQRAHQAALPAAKVPAGAAIGQLGQGSGFDGRTAVIPARQPASYECIIRSFMGPLVHGSARRDAQECLYRGTITEGKHNTCLELDFATQTLSDLRQ